LQIYNRSLPLSIVLQLNHVNRIVKNGIRIIFDSFYTSFERNKVYIENAFSN